MTRDITLCAVSFRVTEQDGQVIFLNTGGIAADYKWARQHYLPHFVNGTAKRITYQDEIIKDPQT